MGKYPTETELIKQYTGTWGVEKKFPFVRDFYKGRRNSYVNLVFIVFLGLIGGQRLYMHDEHKYVYPILSLLGVIGFFVLRYFFEQRLRISVLPLLLVIPVIIRMAYDFFTFRASVSRHNQRLALKLSEKYGTKRKKTTINRTQV